MKHGKWIVAAALLLAVAAKGADSVSAYIMFGAVRAGPKRRVLILK